jgi:hypothetical protein
LSHSDLQRETTQAPVTENKHGHKKHKRVYFLICESCFWCASALSLRPIKDELVPKCPMCDDDYCISIVPISTSHQDNIFYENNT